MSWLKGGAPLDVASSARFIQLPDQGSGSHRLLLTAATDADVGTYSCQAANSYGTQQDTTYGEWTVDTARCKMYGEWRMDTARCKMYGEWIVDTARCKMYDEWTVRNTTYGEWTMDTARSKMYGEWTMDTARHDLR